MDVRTPWLSALLLALVATSCGHPTDVAESSQDASPVLIEPQPAEEVDDPSSISDLLSGASAVVVARLVSRNAPLQTGMGDRAADTSVFTMAVQQRLAGDIADQFDLATVFSDVDGSRVDQLVISDEAEFLLFVTPFRWGSSPRAEFTAVGSLRGVFVRPIGSDAAFVSVVTEPNQIVDRIAVDDIAS